ncbi:MAG: diaminopimelate epimerase [Actinomycetota bacterium]|nr:diaminopimelate epimerase [Actinomycetota bacterium]
MTPMPVTDTFALAKYHGAGNDFLVALELGGPVEARLGPHLARRVCDRHRGIGADGLIVGRLAPADSGARLTFQLFNADGGEAEMSGNGLRCLAHAALDADVVDLNEPFGVLTLAGCKEVTLQAGDRAGRVWGTVEMGQAKIVGEVDRGNVGHGQLLVDMGNPHLVVAGPDPATIDVAGLGALLEATEPAGLNVEFATLGPGTDHLTMRVWERGVGETLACGTGACAAAVAFHHWGRVGRSVTVHQTGGAVAVTITSDGRVTLAGPSERIAFCTVGLT